MSYTDDLHVETKLLPVTYHSVLLAKQYWLSCYQSHHPCHHLTTMPAPVRNMKGTLMKYNSKVVPLSDEGITDVDTYRDCLRTLHSQAVVEAKMNFVPNRVLGASPPDISPLESLLPRSVRTTLEQLHSGHCQLLNSYKARIISGISDVCPECGVAPHSVEHLFNCQKAIRRNLQCKTCGTTRLRSQTSQPGQLTIRVRTILVLGYWVLGNIQRYWVVLLLGDIFCCSDTQYNTNQTAVSTVHVPVNDYLVPLLTCTLTDAVIWTQC